MNPITTSFFVLAWAMAGAAGGVRLRTILPDGHLTPDAKDVIKLATGLVGTILALVLGLLVSSSRTFYETQSNELQQLSTQVILLDRVLAHYGAESQEAREILRRGVARTLDQISSDSNPGNSGLDPSAGSEVLFEAIQRLLPRDEEQKFLRTQALATVIDLGKTRWLMYEQTVSTMPKALLIVIGFWLSMMFFSFGLLAPHDRTMMTSLFLSAFSVSAAVLVILEMYNPYQGFMRISNAPMTAALAHLGK
jgi:hypothetical protein